MNETQQRKNEIRRRAHANRRALRGKEQLSREIGSRVRELAEYRGASTVLYYVDRRDEVRTRDELNAALASAKKVVVPYCVGDQLDLFHLASMDELEVRTFGILEPTNAAREVEGKRVDVSELDVIIVPGVGFDRNGGRVGHGRGFYDRLLHGARPDTKLIALAFECQLFAEVPMQKHDVFMDFLVTEKTVYQGRGRAVRT